MRRLIEALIRPTQDEADARSSCGKNRIGRFPHPGDPRRTFGGFDHNGGQPRQRRHGAPIRPGAGDFNSGTGIAAERCRLRKPLQISVANNGGGKISLYPNGSDTINGSNAAITLSSLVDDVTTPPA